MLLTSETSSVRGGATSQFFVCRQCGTFFGFQNYRLGTGSAKVVAMLNVDSAEDAASEQAVMNAIHLASVSPDMVPCPTCDHIQPEMIDEFGRGTLHGRLLVGGVTMVISLIVFVVMTWAYAGSPSKKEPMSDSAFAIGMSAGGLLFAIGALIVLHRALLIRRSRPIEGPHAAQTLIDLGFMPALVPAPVPPNFDEDVPDDRQYLALAKPVLRRPAADGFYAPLLKQKPPKICPECLKDLPANAAPFVRCSACDRTRFIIRMILIAVFTLAGALTWLDPPSDDVTVKQLIGQYLLVPLIGGSIGAFLGATFFSKSVATRVDRQRGVYRVPLRYQQYVEVLVHRYSHETRYDCTIRRDVLDEIRKRAKERAATPLPSPFVRWLRKIKTAMTTELTR